MIIRLPSLRPATYAKKMAIVLRGIVRSSTRDFEANHYYACEDFCIHPPPTSGITVYHRATAKMRSDPDIRPMVLIHNRSIYRYMAEFAYTRGCLHHAVCAEFVLACGGRNAFSADLSAFFE